MQFEFQLPTQIVFGRGRLAELGRLARPFGQRAFVVTGRNAMRETGALGRALGALGSDSVEAEVFDGISPDPRSDEVDAAIARAREYGASMIIGLGGGSALDAAKAVMAGLAHSPDSVGELIGQTLEPHPGSLPIIAIPSTAGTGSEVSRGAIVTDVERQFKSSIRGLDLAPKVALVDSELAGTAPRVVAMETAFDALTHAIETFVCRRATPLGRALSRHAFWLFRSNLPRLEGNAQDPDVIDALALAALIGGMNVGNSGSCLPHRLQQAMGALPHVKASHPRGVASLYRAWLRRAEPYAKGRFGTIASLLGGDDIVSLIDDLLPMLEMDATLGSLGVGVEDLDRIVASVSGDVRNDPIEDIDDLVLLSILEDSL